MNIKTTKAYFILLLLVIISCNSKSSESNNDESLNNSYTIEQENTGNETSYETDDSDSVIENTDSSCKFEDGNYSATVDYNNSETGYSATYTLDVEVLDCQVVQINFPNDGYLDGDHISYADIDEDGRASVYGEDGKTYQIQIDN